MRPLTTLLASLKAQATALMPAKLLNALSEKQVLDLLAFLAKLK